MSSCLGADEETRGDGVFLTRARSLCVIDSDLVTRGECFCALLQESVSKSLRGFFISDQNRTPFP